MRTIQELMDLRGRVAVITGGAGHIGRAMAESLAECGARVVLADRETADPEGAARELAQDSGGDIMGMAADISDENTVRALPGRVAQRLGGLDILVNNAAFVGTSNLTGWVTPFEEQCAATWRAAVEVNLTAPVFLVQAALPWLRAGGRGSVINIGSIYGAVGPDMRLYESLAMGNPAAYAASKGGLIQMTRWLASVLAPQVRVNCVSPGGVWRNQPEAFVARYTARTPQRRMATEEDFKGVVAWLAGDMSQYVTGQHILVDGGFTAW